jgi:hypothetical protein
VTQEAGVDGRTCGAPGFVSSPLKPVTSSSRSFERKTVTANQMAIVGLTTCTVMIGALALGNSRTERQNRALFERTGELKAARSLPVTMLLMALVTCALAFAVDHGGHDRTWGLALIAMLAVVFAWFMTLFPIRLEPEVIRFGLRSHRSVAYADIAELVRVSGGKSVEYVLVLRSGERCRLGEGLACAKLFAEELQRRSGCKVWEETARRHRATDG